MGRTYVSVCAHMHRGQSGCWHLPVILLLTIALRECPTLSQLTALPAPRSEIASTNGCAQLSVCVQRI